MEMPQTQRKQKKSQPNAGCPYKAKEWQGGNVKFHRRVLNPLSTIAVSRKTFLLYLFLPDLWLCVMSIISPSKTPYAYALTFLYAVKYCWRLFPILGRGCSVMGISKQHWTPWIFSRLLKDRRLPMKRLQVFPLAALLTLGSFSIASAQVATASQNDLKPNTASQASPPQTASFHTKHFKHTTQSTTSEVRGIGADEYYRSLNERLSPQLSVKSPALTPGDKNFRKFGTVLGATCLGVGVYEGAHFFKGK
jgi:hypothetical protein